MPSIREAFAATPLEGNRVFPIDFNSVEGVVPDSHTWRTNPGFYNITDERIISSTVTPIIDLNNPNVVKDLEHACENWYAYQVINHGVPLDMIKNLEQQCDHFFTLGMKHKLRAAKEANGITGYGSAHISSFYKKKFWFESFGMIGSPAEHCKKIWPDQEDQCFKFCDAMEKYQKEMQDLCTKLMKLVINSLGMRSEDLDQFIGNLMMNKNPETLLQLNSYPVCPDPSKAMGLGAHTDSSFFTVLHQTRPGLQIYKNGLGWVEVPHIENALVIFMGDLTAILSNSRYPSSIHRAVVNQTYHRYSIPFFYGPPRDVQISPILMLNGESPVFRSVTWDEFLLIKATKFDKALESIRILS
ncbi:hypothetical protein MKW94_022594 [Papaver nudicaule]|uniref:Fe2OG dioxygenase domain-containing protein n=1 Tax=Papaver nudicaule TaxID=74823 RepID=A0AA41VMD7_PAPNU|nr:hypothetical protein [Papaver nudicaule]